MKHSLNILAGILLVLQSIPADTSQIRDFDSLMKALKSGETVRVVIHYAQCQLISDNEIHESAPDAIGGMTIATWEYFAKGFRGAAEAFVVASENKLIAYPKGEGYVYNYAKIRVSENGKVKLTARYIDAKTMETVMDENFFSQVNDGKNDGAVYFYKVK